MSRNQVTITVSGGSVDENRQLSSMVHASMVQQGFSNVSINALDVVRTPPGQSVFDLIRSMNPEVYDTPIEVIGENDEDIAVQESTAMSEMAPSYFRHQASHLYNAFPGV